MEIIKRGDTKTTKGNGTRAPEPGSVSGAKTMKERCRVNLSIVFYSGLAFVSLAGLVLGEAEMSKAIVQTRPVAQDYRCISTNAAEDIPAFTRSHIMWPDSGRITRNQVAVTNNQVSEAVQSTILWVKKVVRPEFVPEKPTALALKGDVDGHDVIRFRYAIDDSIVEVASTAPRLTFVIQRKDRAASDDLKEGDAKTFVSSIIDQFLNDADRVKATAFLRVSKTKHGYYGAPTVRPETCNYWWGPVVWWTDGKVVVLSLQKADGGPLEPTPKDNWFSSIK